MLTHPAPRSIPAGHPLGTAVIITSTIGDQVSVALAGEVDATNADRLRTTLFAHIDEGRTEVILDISALTFIDCAGVTAVRKAAAYAKAAGGSLRLRGEPHPAVHRILQLTRMAASATG